MGFADAIAPTKKRAAPRLPRLLLTCSIVTAPTWALAQTATVRPEVLSSFPHDPTAFTQGLLLFDSELYESTGLEGQSTVRRVRLESGEVLQRTDLIDTEFGEGLALVDDRLVQLTWQNGVAHVYDRATLTKLESFDYDGEGWGLCFDGAKLLMTDGSSTLFFRDPQTFDIEGQVTVTLDGAPVARLNELECVGELVYANVWQTDFILRIDPRTGTVLTRIDASGLLTAEEEVSADVLNGIAYDASTDHFYLTGKLWPRLFEVRFPFDSGKASNDPDAGNEAPLGEGGAAPANSQGMSPTAMAGSPGEPEMSIKVAPPPRQSGACMAIRRPTPGPAWLACAMLSLALFVGRRHVSRRTSPSSNPVAVAAG